MRDATDGAAIGVSGRFTMQVAPGDVPNDVLLFRAWSGPWGDAIERTGEVRAAITVYRDGLVVADVSPVGDRKDYRAVRLDKAEVVALRDRIAELKPVPFENASGVASGCFDCSVQVIRVRVGDRAVEIAVYGLSTAIGVIPKGTPGSAIGLSKLLDDLEAIVANRPAIAFDRTIPTILAAPQIGG